MRHVAGFLIALLCGFTALPAAAQDEPAISIETRPLGEVLELAKLAGEKLTAGGKPEAAAQFQSAWNSLLGENLEVIKSLDLKRPAGGYGFLNDKMMGVALVPVADEKGFLELLGKWGIENKAAQKGSYELTLPGFPPAHLRFADRYAQIAFGPTATSTGPNPIGAARFFNPAAGKPALSFVVRPRRISPLLRNLFVSGMQNSKKEDNTQREGESDVAFRARLRGQQLGEAMATEVLTSLVSDSESIAYTFDLSKTGRLVSETRVVPSAETPQAEKIAAWGKSTSLPVEIALPGKPVMSMSISATMFDEQRFSFLEMIDPKSDPISWNLFTFLKTHWGPVPTDLTLRLNAIPEETLPVFAVSAVIQDGETLDKSLRDYIGRLPIADQRLVEFNVAKAGTMAVHSVRMNAEKKPGVMDTVYLAIGKNLVVLAGGKGSLEALVKIKTDGAPVQGIMRGEIAIPALEEMTARHNPAKLARSGKLQPKIDALVKRLFGAPGADKLIFSVTGGNSFLIRTENDLAVIAFIMESSRLDLESLFENVEEELNKK